MLSFPLFIPRVPSSPLSTLPFLSPFLVTFVKRRSITLYIANCRKSYTEKEGKDRVKICGGRWRLLFHFRSQISWPPFCFQLASHVDFLFFPRLLFPFVCAGSWKCSLPNFMSVLRNILKHAEITIATSTYFAEITRLDYTFNTRCTYWILILIPFSFIEYMFATNNS